jgi:hypothetical protein
MLASQSLQIETSIRVGGSSAVLVIKLPTVSIDRCDSEQGKGQQAIHDWIEDV